jgi:hypothetical protein
MRSTPSLAPRWYWNNAASVLATQFAGFTRMSALAADYDQPAYVLTAAGEQLARGVRWPEVLSGDRCRIVAIILPEGTIFERAFSGVA